jgi:Flp pilus assembly protein TadD
LWGCNLFISGDLQAEKNSLHLRLKLQDAMSGRQLRHVELQGNMANLTLFQDGLFSKLLYLVGFPEADASVTYVNTGGTSMPGAYILYLKGRGVIQESRNASRVDRGIVYLEKALQQDDRYTLARLALLEAWLDKSTQKKDPSWRQLAESQWSLVRQAAGHWTPAQLAWGLLLKENGQKEEARLAFRSALELDSRCYDAQIQLGISRAEAGESTEAESLFKKAIRLRPDYPPAYEELAYFYNMNGRFDEALHIYKKIAELTPGDHRIFNNLGGMHMFRGEKDQAKAMFERSNAIEPNVVAQSNLAVLYFYEGDYQKALPLHLEAAKNSTEHNQWGNLADTYRQLPGEEQKAIAAYRKAIILAEKLLVLTPEDAELISWLASYYAHVGEKQKAMAAIARTRSLAPTFLNGIQRVAPFSYSDFGRISSLNLLTRTPNASEIYTAASQTASMVEGGLAVML